MRRVLLALALAAAAAPRSFATGLLCPSGVLDARGYGAVPLFSALPMSGSSFARRWSRALPGLSKEFPDLRFEKPENLHVTLVFVSTAGWDSTRVDDYEKYAMDGPDVSSGPLVMKGALDTFGPKKDVAVLHFSAIPKEWPARLMKDRDVATAKGLRPRDRYDDVFEAHVSLAFARDAEKDRAELRRFEKRMETHAADFDGLSVRLDRAERPALFLVLGGGDSVRFVPLKAYCR